MQVEREVELEINGEYQEVVFLCTGRVLFKPGNIEGAPEDCFPDESECEVESLEPTHNVFTEDGTQVDPKLLKELVSKKLGIDFWVQALTEEFDEYGDQTFGEDFYE